MIVPRIGALFLLIGYGFALAQVVRLLYVTASEGRSSWIAVLVFLAPTGLLGIASALLVLARKPLGTQLAYPFCVCLGVTAVFLFFRLPPIGGFLDDYEQASLARGVRVPTYLAENGKTPEQYIHDQAGDIRMQGALGSIGVLVVYAATVLRGSSTRFRAAKAKA